MKKILISIAVILLVGAVANGQNRQPGQRAKMAQKEVKEINPQEIAKRKTDFYKERLGLSQDQEKRIYEINLKYAKIAKEEREEMMKKGKDRREEMINKNKESREEAMQMRKEQRAETMKIRSERRKEIMNRAKEIDEQIKSVLNPEQKRLYMIYTDMKKSEMRKKRMVQKEMRKRPQPQRGNRERM